MMPKKIERHILIIETPEDRSPSRGDIENSFHWSDAASRSICVSLEHPGTISEDFSKIVMQSGSWKRGHEYIYGPTNEWEKLTQNEAMIKVMRETIHVLNEENKKIRAASPQLLDHYASSNCADLRRDPK